MPVKVTGKLLPTKPLVGLIEDSVGVGTVAFTVNATALLVCPDEVTVTFCGPVGALPAIVNVAVI